MLAPIILCPAAGARAKTAVNGVCRGGRSDRPCVDHNRIIGKKLRVRYGAVIFDLDGTLIDTLEDLTNAMNFGLRALSLPQHTPEACRRMIGDGVRTFAWRALPAGKEGLRDELVRIMGGYYADHCFDHSRVYNGMGEALVELRGRGVRLAVVTNKDQPYAETVVNHFFAAGTFEHIVGTGPDTPVKPDPAGLIRIVEAMGLTREACLYVGDSDTDIRTAANAEMPFVGAAWGFRGREALTQAGATVIADRPADIVDLTA